MGTGHSSRRNSFDANGQVNFDHFQILRAIGKGSFGKVCIVQKKDTKQMFAMKYMNKAMCARQAAITNVIRELDMLTRLDHPFLVNLWYAFQDEEDLFMVVDLFLGGDLRYHMQQEVAFKEECVKFYLCELVLVLDYLRSQKIIHRDIKPDNILLDEQGHCHVTDFNIATQLEDDELATSTSGTRPYMACRKMYSLFLSTCQQNIDFLTILSCSSAHHLKEPLSGLKTLVSAPEVYGVAINERRGYSFSVDWWSLGVSLFELLKKRRPFAMHSNTTMHDMWATMMASRGQLIHLHNVSDGMKDILRLLLEFEPEDRLCSLAQLKLHSYVADVDFEALFERHVPPPFIPSKEQLNCDPTYELEEMIIETKPLHKKKKRLAKQNSRQSSEDKEDMELQNLTKRFHYYNREESKAEKPVSGPLVQPSSPTNIKSSLPGSEAPCSSHCVTAQQQHNYSQHQRLQEGPIVTLPRPSSTDGDVSTKTDGPVPNVFSSPVPADTAPSAQPATNTADQSSPAQTVSLQKHGFNMDSPRTSTITRVLDT